MRSRFEMSPKRTSYPTSGGVDVSVSARVLPPLPHQDVPHHPKELDDDEAGDEREQVLFLDRGSVVGDGQHQRRPDEEHVGAVLAAQDLRVLPRVVPGQVALQLGEDLLVVLGARGRGRAVTVLAQAHDVQAVVLHHDAIER